MFRKTVTNANLKLFTKLNTNVGNLVTMIAMIPIDVFMYFLTVLDVLFVFYGMLVALPFA